MENSVKLVGRLARDPQEFSSTKTLVVGVTIACDFYSGGKEQADFIPLTLFGQQAETVLKNCKQGDLVSVEAFLKMDRWESNGEKRSRLQVCGKHVKFLARAQKNLAETA
jgi:single-strand DNA-binding protein